jgi:hypothetical protein
MNIIDPNSNDIIISVFLRNLDLAKFATNKPGRAEPRKKDSAFPIKLHRMLQDVEREGLGYIVSWHPDGRSFRVQFHDQFVARVLPGYFSQTKYRSFQRQLNHYSFKRITKGPLEGSYHHPYFVRDNPALCEGMRREKKDGKKSSTTVSAAEPKTSTPEEGPIPTECTLVSHSPDSTSMHSSTSELNVVASSPDQIPRVPRLTMNSADMLLLKLPKLYGLPFVEDDEEEIVGKYITCPPSHADTFEDLCGVFSDAEEEEEEVEICYSRLLLEESTILSCDFLL